MIGYKEATAMAEEYFLNNYGWGGIASALESPSEWFFTNGEPGEIVFGGAMIGINKETGEILSVYLPSEEGFARLEDAEEITDKGSEQET